MGLSKEDIDSLEEDKIATDATCTQKRRHRRKILKAAKAGKDLDIPEVYVHVGVTKNENKGKGSAQVCSNKCQNSITETPILTNNQKSASEKSNASKDLKSLCTNPINNNKSTPKVIKNKGTKAEVSHLKNNENTLQSKLAKSENTKSENTTETKNPESENLISNKKQKSKSKNSDQSQQSNFEDICVAVNKKNKSAKTGLNENQAAAKLKSTKKKEIESQNLSNNDDQKQKINKVFDIENQEKLHRKEQNFFEKLTPEKLYAIICHNALAGNSKKENQKPTLQRTVTVDKEILASDKRDMEKLQNATRSEKQQLGLSKNDTKNEDTAPIAIAGSAKSREEVKASKEAKKLAKQKAMKKNDTELEDKEILASDKGDKEKPQSATQSGTQPLDLSKNDSKNEDTAPTASAESVKSREDVKAAREAKKLAKQKALKKNDTEVEDKEILASDKGDKKKLQNATQSEKHQLDLSKNDSKNEDTALTTSAESAKYREEVKAAREAKKLSKQKAMKKSDTEVEDTEILASDKGDKEKLQNATQSEKQQLDLSKNDSKNEDTALTTSAESFKSREEVKAAREAKKLSKQKAMKKNDTEVEDTEILASDKGDKEKLQNATQSEKQQLDLSKNDSKNEDTAPTASAESAKSREAVKAAREAKKLAKQKAKKKNDTEVEDAEVKQIMKVDASVAKTKDAQKDVEPIKLTSVAKLETPVEVVNDSQHKEDIPPSDKGRAVDTVIKTVAEKANEGTQNEASGEKSEDKDKDGGKSKAQLKAERRAKQEAQRAAKLAAQKPPEPEAKDKEPSKSKEEKSPKPKSAEKPKAKIQSVQKVGWFQDLNVEKDKDYLKNIPINSNLHPAVLKLGVQLEAGVIRGANARTVALLDAIKKMVREYSLPARTEAARGLQAQLAAAEAFLAARRAPSAPDRNALKHLRRALTLLPPHIAEYDAKSALQEEIDRYIREQIDMAGEAISLILRTKISPGDHILTYGCSSLIERALAGAWAANVPFRTTVAGARGQRAGEMVRRLRAHGVPAQGVDLAALGHVMEDVQKVLVGAGALFAHGAALGAAGCAQAALLARARNVPVLVACETHKFSERTALDALAAHELGDPDELIDKTDESSPLRDWRSNPRLTLLNVTHDVTPPSLISAVVTELGILPCTSAPVVLRFKQAEYGM